MPYSCWLKGAGTVHKAKEAANQHHLGFGFRACGATGAVMAQQKSVGTRDTSRQDKACCLYVFPLQCFWTMAAPALVLCSKPIRLHGTTGAAEYHGERKHNEMSHTAGQTVFKKIIQGIDFMGYTRLPGIKTGHLQDKL